MAIAFDTQSSTSWAFSSSYNWSHTCTWSDRLLVVGIAARDSTSGDRTPASITYAWSWLTKILENSDGDFRTSLWYIINPASWANSIVVTHSGSVTAFSWGAISLTWVLQVTPLDWSWWSQNPSSDALSATISTSESGSWIVDVLGSNTLNANYVANWSQSIRVSTDGDPDLRMSTLWPIIPAWSTGVWYTWSGVWNRDATYSAAAFKPAPTADTTSWFFMYL